VLFRRSPVIVKHGGGLAQRGVCLGIARIQIQCPAFGRARRRQHL
jgi:hypothetical protein